MKKSIFQMVFKAVCLVILCAFSINTHAQLIDYSRWSQEKKENKSLELINEAKYVVEGYIKDFRCFYGEDGKTIYTDLTVEVKHWYKGKGKDVIHIIRKGGVIDEDDQNGFHVPTPFTPTGETYILLLNRHTSGKDYVFSKVSHSVVARPTQDFYMVGFHGLLFTDIEEFNRFIAKGDKIKLRGKKKDVGYIKSSIVPEISSISPLVTRAGTGEVIVISGSGFGNDRGHVQFVNADFPELFLNGPIQYIAELNDIYYDTSDPNNIDNNDDGWTNNEIRVIVPSNVQIDDFKGNAGSGKIRVKLPDVVDADGNVVTEGALSQLSPQRLTIEYSLRNAGEFDINQQMERPMSAPLIGMEHCLSGYVFTLHRSFDPTFTELSPTQRQDAINSIESALTTWGDLLGITLELEKSGNDYYYHPSTGDIHRNIISFVSFFETPGEITNKLMRTQNRGIEWDDMCSTPSDCLHRVSRVTGSNILIKKDNVSDGNVENDWFYAPTGAITSGGPLLDFHAAILHEIGHAIGVGHDVKLNIAGQINRQNLMSYAFVSQQRSEAQRINLTNNANDKGINAAEQIVTDSRNHEWSDDFFDRFGIKTLADKENLSTVLSTPLLSQNGPIPESLSINTQIKLRVLPRPFGYTYYWLPIEETGWRKRVFVCREPHYVRAINASCTVSSVYSLPEVLGLDEALPLDGCPGSSNGRDDETLLLYPNPTTGQLNIEFQVTEEKSIEQLDTHIGIYDNLGRLQKQHRVSDTILRQTTIDISTLPAGMYWVVWFVGGEVIDTQQVQKTE